MIRLLKRLTKKTFNLIGLDIVRISKSPRSSILGLRKLPIRTIIDVGANTGQFARYISDLFPEGDILAFEPLAGPFKELQRWANQMGERVTVFNLAIGEEEGGFEIFNHEAHSPSSSFLKTTDVCETLYPFTKKQVSRKVKLSTLDKIIGSLSRPLVPDILIKLDVQGYEDRVVRGGRETFKMAKACILEVNLDKLYQKQTTFNDITFLLYELGYRYAGNLAQAYADDGHVIYIDAVFMKSQDKLL